MRTRPVRIGLAVGTAVATGMLAVACTKSPTLPASRPDEGAPFTRFELAAIDTTPFETGLEPTYSVAPGQTVQLQLIGHKADGTKWDLTREALWGGSSEYFAITAPGLVLGKKNGEGVLWATYLRGQHRASVVVVPTGTYRLTGQVVESREAGIVVEGARLEVTNTAGTDLVAMSDAAGIYRLYGLAGDTAIRVTKDGYQHQSLNIGIANHTSLDIVMPLLVPRPDVSGSYTLTVTAADECRVALPEEARVRRYAASLSQYGNNLYVVVQGAMRGLDAFTGRLEPDRLRFDLSWYQDMWYDGGYYPQLAEQLTSTILVITGSAVTTSSADRSVGVLDGSFEMYDSYPWGFGGPPKPAASCSGEHQFQFSR